MVGLGFVVLEVVVVFDDPDDGVSIASGLDDNDPS